MKLIDTHVHLLHPDRFSYAWREEAPALQRAFHVGDYREECARLAGCAQIESMVFMEADVPASQQSGETAFFSRLADEDRGRPSLSAIIAGAWPESDDFPGRLEELAGNPRVRGLRRVLHTMPDELSQSALFAENLRRLPALGWTFDLCARPRHLPLLVKLARRCPDTQFVLDHCGVPNIAAMDLDPWRENIRTLAALPNMVCKISGLSSCANPAHPLLPQMRPFVEHCVESFGPDRVLWGSDWPVCSLPDWFGASLEVLGQYSEPEQVRIGTENARRIYRLM